MHYGYKRDQHETRVGVVPNPYGMGSTYTYEAPPEHEGQGIDLNGSPPGGGAPQYFELAGQDGNGDGTVPLSSSRSLLQANSSVKAGNSRVSDARGQRVPDDIAGVDHGGFFSGADAIRFTMMAIRQLDLKYRKLKIGI